MQASADPRTELFTGIDANNNSVSGYLGAGYAFGKGLYESGWRLRAVGSFGAYDYEGAPFDPEFERTVNFDGKASFVAVTVGYQFRMGSLFLKTFAGVEAEDQEISPRDPNNSVQGTEVGLRLQAESWLDLSPTAFLSLDAAYGTAFQEYWSLARLGYRIRPRLSIGLEGGALGNEEYDAGRGGSFVRWNWREAELTLSGGVTGNYLEDEASPYVSLGIYRAY